MKQFCLCVDLDDTLIPNAYTYFQPQLEMAGLICWAFDYHSPNPTYIINRATEKQVKLIKELGYISKHNFPLSYVDVYKEMCEEKNIEFNPKISSAIAMAGIKYFQNSYSLYPGVKETLESLKSSNNWHLIILTRGDLGVQQYKIDNTEIGKYFDNIEIVARKDTQTYLDIKQKYNLDESKTVMIGDSLRNDILPALEAGFYGIQVSAEDASDWEKSLGNIEIKENSKYYKIKDFTEIIDCLDKIFVPNSV